MYRLTFLLVLVLLLAGGLHATTPTISPLNPAVNGGAQVTMLCTANCGTGGTWSCSGTDGLANPVACAGSINSSTGVYTAPSHVTAQQTIGGTQLLPNNHIINTRIDSFPLRSDSATLIANSGTSPLQHWGISKPINYITNATPTQSMVFFFTAPNNGSYRVQPFPQAKLEDGYLDALANHNKDHHFLQMNTDADTLTEFYQFYQVGDATGEGCPLCNSQSGLTYNANSYALPTNGTTDAAGLPITPLMMRLQELEQAVATGGTINHAIRMTQANGFLTGALLWPATTFTNQSGMNFYGERLRLKASFNISTFSPIAQIILKQAQQYGLIIADGGTGFATDVEYNKLPKPIMDAIMEVYSATIRPSNFEVVDESSFQLASGSGECTCNREIITYTSSTGTATTDIVLTGVAVNFSQDLLQIQVGAPAQQISAFVGGTTNTALTWTMSPSVGTLSSTGLYTPPVSVSVPTTVTVTATSQADPTVAAEMTVNVFPAGQIRLVPGNIPAAINFQMNPTTYVDSLAHSWYSIGDDGGYASSGACTTTGTSDPALYCHEYAAYASGASDVRFDFIVPNGTYQVVYKGASTFGGAGTQIQNLEINGVTVYPSLDLFVASGGSNIAFDFTTNVTITDNNFHFVQRIINSIGTHIGALQFGIFVPPNPPPAPALPAFMSNSK